MTKEKNPLPVLSPCPHCGGRAEYRSFTSRGWLYKITAHYVSCAECDSRTGFEDSPAKAAEKWNRRTDKVVDGYQKTEWISVDEGFPKVAGREYLVWDDVQKTIKKRFFYRLPTSIPVEKYPYIREYFGNSTDYKSYTHWRHLPEPPKTNGGE